MAERFRPNPERREGVAKLVEYLAGLGDGERRSWLEVERATGVKMDECGRSWLREARTKARRPMLVLPTYGFETSSKDNTDDFADKAVRGVASAIERGSRTVAHVSARHGHELTQEKRNRLLLVQATLEAVSVSATARKQLTKG